MGSAFSTFFSKYIPSHIHPTTLAKIALAVNTSLMFILILGVAINFSSIGDNYYILLAACASLMLCVLPPTISVYTNLISKLGNTYSYKDYIVQIFIPICIGLIFLLSIIFSDILKEFEMYDEHLIIYLGGASLLSSTLTYIFMLYRIKFQGT
jgi:hypothetical protein